MKGNIKMKDQSQNKTVEVEAFIQKCLNAKKTIIIPWTKTESKKRIKWAEKMLKKKLISQEYFNRFKTATTAITLDNHLYKDYQKCVKLLRKSGQGCYIRLRDTINE